MWRRLCCPGRRFLGTVLALSGVMLIFLCLPMRILCLLLGISLAAAGLWLLG